MDMLENILSKEIVHKLGWTLLHSLWQGGIVVLLLVVCLRVLGKFSANLRYVISCLGLAVIVLLPVVTFYIVPAPAPTSDVESVPGFEAPVTEKPYKVYDADMPLQRATEYMQISSAASWRQKAKDLCTYALPFVVVGWFIGVLILSLWHTGGWAYLQRLKRKNVNRVASSLKDKLHNLAGRLKVTRPVLLMESALVQIPIVVGWFRPVILLPASALSGLTTEQIEALLAHELAHIRRYDYLVNMFQTVVEILGFYHPAVWWISHTMRVERENCCDDLAVSVGGDKMAYARALTTMEEIRLGQDELVIAANGGNLFTRISRLVSHESARKARHVWTPVVLSALLIIVLAIPATLALTAGGLRADSTSTYVSELADEENISSSVDTQSTSHLPDINSKTQILFDCEIYEVPADLKFIEDEQRKGISGPIMKLLESLKSEREKGAAGISIQLGKEYADSLKALNRENEYVKVLAAPKLMALDGKEATVNTTQNVSYTADYKTDKGDDKPIPIIKNLPCEMELKVKGEVAKNNTIFTHLRLTLSKPVFATKQNDEGREIQIPIIERSDCTTYVGTRSGESIILGGLRSDEGSSRNLILVITPSIIRPEKGLEQAKIEKEIRAIAYDPEHIVVFPETEKGNVIAETRRPEQDKVMLEQQARDLEQKAAELHQLQKDIQKQIEDLERKKSELLSYNRITTSLREAKSEHERLAVMAAIFAERGDFAKAIEHLEKAIELAKDKKDYGIGIAIEEVDGLIRISQLLPGAPASGSSFRQGDIIMAIDGVSTEGVSLNEVVARIRGPKGTKVTLTVKSHSRDIIVEETFTRQLLLKGSPALQEYYRRLDAYEAGKTWPQYREMMKYYKPWSGETVQIYELKNADPEELAELLNRILQRRWKGIKDKPKDSVKIVPDPGHNKLIVLASPTDIRLIGALIAELDVIVKRDTTVLKALPDTEYKKDQAAGSTITKVIKLKYADCESIEQILRQILSDEHFKIATDKRTNMLIVAGTESAIEEVKALVAEIDVSVPEKNLEVGELEKQKAKDF